MSLDRLAPAGLCLLAVLAAGCVLDAPYAKYAIVYGISDYEGIGNDLQFAAADAMKNMLKGQGYKVWLQTDAAANRTQLLDDASDVALAAKENDSQFLQR